MIIFVKTVIDFTVFLAGYPVIRQIKTDIRPDTGYKKNPDQYASLLQDRERESYLVFSNDKILA